MTGSAESAELLPSRYVFHLEQQVDCRSPLRSVATARHPVRADSLRVAHLQPVRGRKERAAHRRMTSAVDRRPAPKRLVNLASERPAMHSLATLLVGHLRVPAARHCVPEAHSLQADHYSVDRRTGQTTNQCAARTVDRPNGSIANTRHTAEWREHWPVAAAARPFVRLTVVGIINRPSVRPFDPLSTPCTVAGHDILQRSNLHGHPAQTIRQAPDRADIRAHHDGHPQTHDASAAPTTPHT